MLSAGYFFRGNYASSASGQTLLSRICQIDALAPEKWGLVEPLNRDFRSDEVAQAFEPPKHELVSWIVFLVRKSYPRYLGGIMVSRGDYPNDVFFQFGQSPRRAENLIGHVESVLLPAYPDYAYVGDARQDDVDRFAEAYLPRTAAELFGSAPPLRPPFFAERFRSRDLTWWFTPLSAEMRGPAGWLWDVVWYNFFGKNYVDLIGKERLAGAGWARVEQVGDGLACYATEKIDSAHSRERRDKILANLEEFFWTPGCKPEEKRAPIFDFSEQLATLSSEMRLKMSERSTAKRVIFAGFSEEEKKQAVRKIEEATGGNDPDTRSKHKE